MSRLSNIAATAALFLAVLVVGGVHSATAVAVAILATLAVATQQLHLRRRGDAHVYVSLFGCAFALLCVASLLQIIPVPTWLHGLLNPTGQAWTASGLEASGLTLESMRPLSLDPAATADRAVRFFACAMMSFWAANVRSSTVPRSFSPVLGALAVITLVTGFIFSALDIHSFLGLFYSEVGFRRPSTFVSLNHGAIFFGWITIVAGLRVARLRAAKESVAAPLLFGTAMLAATLVHDSDGVNIALFICATLAGVVAWLRSGRPTPPRHVAIGVALIGAMSAAAAIWLDVPVLLMDTELLAGEHGARFDVMRASLLAIGDFWRFGAGGGGLETVISSYLDHAAVGAVSVPVVENETLELLLGYGVFVGGAAIALFVAQIVYLVPRALSSERRLRHAGALIVALFFALVAQLHFPLLPLGIVLPIVVWLELAWSRRRRKPRSVVVQRSGHLKLRPIVFAAVVGLLSVGATAAAVAWEAWRSPELPTGTDGAATYVWLRPADARLYARMATNAARAGETERVTALANHAYVREPSTRLELFRARALAVHSQSESARAYARLLGEPRAKKMFVAPFLADVRNVDDRVDALAEHPDLWGPVVTEIYTSEGADAASTLVVALTSAFGDRPEPYRVAADLYLRMNRPVLARLWAEQLAVREERSDVEVIESPLHLARALHASGKSARARELLDEVLEHDPLPEAHRLALRIDAGTEPLADPESTRRHHEVLCVSPIESRDRRICWETEARLAEGAGDLATAERVLHRVWKREGEPRPLARFHARRGECAAIRTIAGQMPDGRRRTQVEAIATKCLGSR